MTVLAFGSSKASPGVTTSVIALAACWPTDREVLVVEADPHGGDLAARGGLRLQPNVATLAAEARHMLEPGDLVQHVQRLPGGLPVLTAPADRGQATRALEMVAGELAGVLRLHDVLIDIGRFGPSSPAMPLVDAADHVIVVTRPRLDELQHVGPCAGSLAGRGYDVALLLVGEEPYSADEVADALDLPVAGVLPDDGAAAEVLSGLGTAQVRLRRSRLMRASRELAERLCMAGPTGAVLDVRDHEAVGEQQAVSRAEVMRP